MTTGITEIKSTGTAIDERDFIHIQGARLNNLKNINVVIPKNQLVVVTGLSGSGKSSLIMDTLYAEGQRRYVESLSSYARQFLNRMKKPEVDYIKGLCPAIAIEQRVGNRNARSTVGSMTEIYDLLRVLYARIGKTISPISGKEVHKQSVSDVVDGIMELEEGSRLHICAPFDHQDPERTLSQELNLLIQKGFTRIMQKNKMLYIDDFVAEGKKVLDKKLREVQKDYQVLIDRVVVKKEDEENLKRIADSVQTAYQESEGLCLIYIEGKKKPLRYSNRFELDGLEFPELSPQLFNFNNPYGACPRCEGYGRVIGIDRNKVLPDPSLSVYEGAIACWSGEKSSVWLDRLLLNADQFDFPIHRPVNQLEKAEIDLLFGGNSYFEGIDAYFSELESKTYKIQNRVILARYRGRTTCPECQGHRLRKEAMYVKVDGKHIGELTDFPIAELHQFFAELSLEAYDKEVASRLLLEIHTRLSTMVRIGLGYLTLDRISSTLSGGETQRINLTRTLGSNLSDSLYILDEPSIGLHPKDTDQLVEVLKSLRDLGNTVIVVEHEEEVIKAADHILDMGPGAGIHGGEVVFNGAWKKFLKAKGNLTSDYLVGLKAIQIPEVRRPFSNKILIKGARHHNLKDVDVTFPLQAMTVVSGVSGSGKSTLVRNILYPAIRKELGQTYNESPGHFKKLEGDYRTITQVEFVSQNPIGRSSRSNPVTYIKAYDSIRKQMVKQQLSKIRGYKNKHFSFNVDGGRCETCKGDGNITIEMQFLADIQLVCEDCKGRRFKDEVLEVQYKGKNIHDILELNVTEAITFFKEQKDIATALQPLEDVGLGYVKLGQPSNTLSGGEAQRVKLAFYLARESSSEQILFIFDEPTTGLHFHDIQKLLDSLNALIERGHSVVIIEHNLEVIKSADWVIDLGPGGGKHGGNLLFEGRPEDLIKSKESHTAAYLRERLQP